MQVAHPAVAAGVAQHSRFEEDPFGRLARTMRTMDRIAFGSPGTARSALRSLAARHSRVSGVTADGTGYSASDPELVLWVHATLIDTVLAVDRRYLGLLDDEDRARFYEETRRLARTFSVPEEMVPSDLAAFHDYMEARSWELAVGPEARAVARAVLRPTPRAPAGLPGAPARWATARLLGPAAEAVTADLLAPPLRRAYGLRRGAGVVPELLPLAPLAGLAALVSRAVTPRVPVVLRAAALLGQVSALTGAGGGG